MKEGGEKKGKKEGVKVESRDKEWGKGMRE